MFLSLSILLMPLELFNNFSSLKFIYGYEGIINDSIFLIMATSSVIKEAFCY